MACRYIGRVVLWRLATFGYVFWKDGISRAATTLILYSELCICMAHTDLQPMNDLSFYSVPVITS